jgi:predicted MPP superfamily phosphohydrolase
MVIVNVVYGHPWHRYFLKAFRLGMGFFIFLAPPLFAWLVDYDVTRVIDSASESLGMFVAAGYLILALSVSCIGLPYVTLRRQLQPAPPCVVSESTETFDVVKELGHIPSGDGKHEWMARRLLFNQIFRVDFTTLTLRFANVPPEWDGLTLLQLSDLHFIGTPAREYYDWVIRHAMADGVPDLLLITGDIVDTEKHHAWIEPILGQLTSKLGAFAVLGNHDWWYDFELVRQELRKLRMHVVGNRWERVDVRGRPMTIIGHEGPWFQPPPDLSDCPTDGFRLLLSHTPDNIRWAQRNHVTLMLSGHNHGGQIRLPLFGSIFVPSTYSRRYDGGTYDETPTLLHVNRGLAGKDPLRFRCNPQVTRIILRSDLVR